MGDTSSSRSSGARHDSGFPVGRAKAPSFLVSSFGVFLILAAVVVWPAAQLWYPRVETALFIVGAVVLGHQVITAVLAWRHVRAFGMGLVDRNDDSGIGKPLPPIVVKEYIRSLVSDGHSKYHQFKWVEAIDLLLEPHKFTSRIVEEIIADDPVARQTVTKELQLGAKADLQGLVPLPIAHFPKGMLLDGFEAKIGSSAANILSYEEGLRLVAYMLFRLRLAEFQKRYGRKFARSIEAQRAFRDRLAKDVAQVANPASEVQPRTWDGRGSVTGSRADLLVETLRENYVLFAVLDRPSRALTVSYTRSTSLHAGTSRSDGRPHLVGELRFHLGQFPSMLAVSTPLLYHCGSYHLRMTLPDGLFVQNHELREKVGGKRLGQADMVGQRNGQISTWSDDAHIGSPYMRARDHRALPYAHFYARNGFAFKEVPHKHVINVAENPFVTLRLSATLLALAAIGLLIAALSMTGGNDPYVLKSAIVAVIVSAPGVLASWSRQVLGVDALRRACLTTQFALRVTTFLSVTGLVLATVQDSGRFRWPVDLHVFGAAGPSIPITDGYWLLLCAFGLANACFVYARYIKMRAQYLALRRRDRVRIISSQERTESDRAPQSGGSP